jgi:hypothetical protein
MVVDVMLWGHFAITCPGALVKVKYQDIFAKNLVASARKLKLDFQQDNNSKHTSKSTKKWLIGYKFNIFQ